MTRYIDADKLTAFLYDEYHGMISDESMRIYQIIQLLNESPTADVQKVKHGKWEQQTEPLGWEDVDCAVCSVCGESYILNEDMDIDDWKEWSRYCPNCGARMDEK